MAEGTRTPDHRDHNPGLYQLSYRHRARPRIAAPSRRSGADRRRENRDPSCRSGRPCPVLAWFGGRLTRNAPALPFEATGARSSVEEQRTSNPRVGGSNPPGRVRYAGLTFGSVSTSGSSSSARRARSSAASRSRRARSACSCASASRCLASSACSSAPRRSSWASARRSSSFRSRARRPPNSRTASTTIAAITISTMIQVSMPLPLPRSASGKREASRGSRSRRSRS